MMRYKNNKMAITAKTKQDKKFLNQKYINHGNYVTHHVYQQLYPLSVFRL